jgi:CheY-like chemotaxis protein
MAELKPILLVEDSPNDVELTLAALERAQLANEVVVARDGAEALDYLFARGAYADRRAGYPAVVLLDIKLPKVDGLEVLAAIKGDPATRHVPVVMLTSSREETDLVRSYELGVNAFVVKPVGFREFFEAIQDLGMFWAILNEPPPASLRPVRRRPGEEAGGDRRGEAGGGGGGAAGGGGAPAP